MDAFEWFDYTKAELRQAEEARQVGNEGRARVCARRAAGYIIEEYYRRKGIPDPDVSAYNRIQHLASQPDLPDQVHDLLRNLTMRVNSDYTLPVEIDLISDVRQMAEELLNEKL
jgi:hypothetical protein